MRDVLRGEFRFVVPVGTADAQHLRLKVGQRFIRRFLFRRRFEDDWQHRFECRAGVGLRHFCVRHQEEQSPSPADVIGNRLLLRR